MKLYSNDLVYKYVNGLEIDEDIDELENNYEFMMQVLSLTKDSKMYNFCSDELKSNYEFVKNVILLFKDDIKFITEVADIYLMKSNRENICTKELIILMSNLTEKIKEANAYNLRSTVFYINELSEIYSCLEYNKKDKQSINLGMGFIFVIDNYSSSKLITDYLAKKFINSIFYEDKNYKFEELMHILIKDINTFDKNKINKFLIDYICSLDNALADYVSCHLELLDKVKKDMEFILKNWDLYIDLLNENRVEIINDYVNNYYEKEGLTSTFSCFKSYEEVVIKLGLEEVFKKYDRSFGNLPDLLCDDVFDFKKVQYENNLTNLIKELWSKDVILDIEDNYCEKPQPKAKILNINFSKRSNN